MTGAAIVRHYMRNHRLFREPGQPLPLCLSDSSTDSAQHSFFLARIGREFDYLECHLDDQSIKPHNKDVNVVPLYRTLVRKAHDVAQPHYIAVINGSEPSLLRLNTQQL